jgi:hypothetical protein
MDRAQIERSFFRYLKTKGLSNEDLSLLSLPTLFPDYYKEIPFEEVDRENDGDILLYQYGIYDWGEGRYFEIDLTRQFYEVFAETEDQQIFQQRVVFYFSADKFEQIQPFNSWSNECTDLDDFRQRILDSDGFVAASREIPLKLEVSVELV